MNSKHAQSGRINGAIDVALGPSLKRAFSSVLTEPLPATLTLAAAGLSMPSTPPSTIDRVAAHPYTPLILPPVVIAAFLCLYLLKSALGIDMFSGNSFLHDLFFE
jgi:hypothetical protein